MELQISKIKAPRTTTIESTTNMAMARAKNMIRAAGS
jgi:hypothetical protein